MAATRYSNSVPAPPLACGDTGFLMVIGVLCGSHHFLQGSEAYRQLLSGFLRWRLRANVTESVQRTQPTPVSYLAGEQAPLGWRHEQAFSLIDGSLPESPAAQFGDAFRAALMVDISHPGRALTELRQGNPQALGRRRRSVTAGMTS
jgi:hypothetical protein